MRVSPKPGVPQSRKGLRLSWTLFKVASVGVGAKVLRHKSQSSTVISGRGKVKTGQVQEEKS
jgi:hypothetical protein